MALLRKNRVKNFKIHMKPQKYPVSQTVQTNKKNNHGEITIPDFKLYYRGVFVKAAWY